MRVHVILSLMAVLACPATGLAAPSLSDRAAAAAREVRDREALVAELAGMGAVDRWMRGLFLDLRKDATDAERADLDVVWKRDYEPVDQRHVARLKALLAGRDWFRKSEVGNQAEQGAYLVVSHSNDLAFQKEVLAKMEPLLSSEPPSGYANLYDRVAVQEGRPQRYGSQRARCVDGRHAMPDNVEDPTNLTARRKAAGLQPMAEYLATLDQLYGRCSEVDGGAKPGG